MQGHLVESQDAFDKKQPLKKFPKFKKRGVGDSFRIPQPAQFQLEKKRIKLPKIGWLHFYASRAVEGEAKQVTVTQSGCHWYVSIQTEQVVEQANHPSKTAIGIDMGVSKLFALSDATHVEPLNILAAGHAVLAGGAAPLGAAVKPEPLAA